MMSLEAIRQMADDATAEAARRGLHPYPIDSDALSRMPGGTDWDGRSPYPFPFLGDHTGGWTLVETHLADASGWGADDEPALTREQLNRLLTKLCGTGGPEIGVGIVECGQFQVRIGIYHRGGQHEVA